MSSISDLTDLVIDLRRRIATLERDVARNKIGTVCDIDPAKGYRLQFGADEDGQPKKSAWLPHPEQGGEARTWMPMSLGQAAMLVSSPGDSRKAILVRGGFAGAFGPPSQSMDEVVLADFGEARVLVKRDRIVLSVGANSIAITADDIVALVGRSTITVADKDIAMRARRHYLFGKVAAGLDYTNPIKLFPTLVQTVGGAAKKFFSKTDGEDIPNDD